MGNVFGKISVLSQGDAGPPRRQWPCASSPRSACASTTRKRWPTWMAPLPVDKKSHVVRFPADVVEASVARLREQFAGEPRHVGRILHAVHGDVLFNFARQPRPAFDANTGGFVPFVLGLEGGRRSATMADVRASIRLADALPNIKIWVGLPCSAQEVPAALRPVVPAAEPGRARPPPLAGWKRSAPRTSPICRGWPRWCAAARQCANSPGPSDRHGAKSPLVIDGNMAVIFIEYVKRGPAVAGQPCLPAAPRRSPPAPAFLALGLAETLGALTLAYAIDRDAVISLDVCSDADGHGQDLPYLGQTGCRW